MTDNIKLPPLPKGDIAADTCPVMWVHSNEQLQAYAREAIEADRKRRGEPVAWVTADTVDGQTVNGKPRRVWWENNEGVGMPIYAAPQPLEVEHPWVAYLNARKDAILHYHAEGHSFDDIAAVLNLADGAHVERIYNATSAKSVNYSQSMVLKWRKNENLCL